MCQAKAVASFTVAWPSGTILAVLSLFLAPLATCSVLVMCHRPYLSQQCPTFQSTHAVAAFGRVVTPEADTSCTKPRFWQYNLPSLSCAFLQLSRCSHGTQVCRDKGSMQFSSSVTLFEGRLCTLAWWFRAFFFHPFSCQSFASLSGISSGLLWLWSSVFSLAFPMWSRPPLSLWNRCVFRVVTSPLTYQVLPSQPCNHGSWIDMPLDTLLGPRRRLCLEGILPRMGGRLQLLPPYRSLRLMTNLSGTHLAASISILSHHPVHALPDQEMFVACSSDADPQGESYGLYFPCGTKKSADDGWSTTRGSPSAPPWIPSTPQSSLQPFGWHR